MHKFVARYTSIRVVLSIAIVMKWKVHQMDVKTTFLNGVIEKKVYMEQLLPMILVIMMVY